MPFSLDKVKVVEVGITTSPLKLEVLGTIYSEKNSTSATQIRFRSNNCPNEVAEAAKAFLEALEASITKDLGGEVNAAQAEAEVSVASI